MRNNGAGIAAFVLAAAYSGLVSAAQRNVQAPFARIAHDISGVHLVIMGIIALIFFGAISLMFYSIYAQRKSARHQGGQFHDSATVEIVWTAIPLLIIVVMAWPATKVLLDTRDTSHSDITIKVTGYQWKWGYEYLKGEGEGISFIAQITSPRDQIYGEKPKGEQDLPGVDNPMVVPINKKIRILATSNDVIHAWSVPALGVNEDAISGFLRETWFRAEKEGTYRGQCAELCGRGHDFMPIVVDVVSAEKYSAWVAEQKRKIARAEKDRTKK